MAKKHESDWNPEQLTDAEIYATIRCLDSGAERVKKPDRIRLS